MKSRILTIVLIVCIGIFTSTAQTLKVDVVKSKLEWKGTKKVGEHSGLIAIKEGNVEMKDGKIVGGQFIIDMKGITILDTEDEGDRKDIISDISSKQFFNVKEHPTAKLVINSYFDGVLSGDLTIKGITNHVEFRTTYKMIGKTLEANTVTFTIDRQLWKLKFGNWFKENVLDDPLEFKVHIVAK